MASRPDLCGIFPHIAMKISQEEVERVAVLARLDLSGDEAARLTRQLDTILQYVAKLDELDTTGIKPTSHAQQITNAFREDIVCPSLPRDKALQNSPEQNGEAFVVPRVL